MLKKSIRMAVICAIALLSVGLFAERSGELQLNDNNQANTKVLQINVNVPGAIVQINNNVMKGYRFALKPAVYSVTVRAPGYADFSTTVNMARDQVLNVQLKRDGGNDGDWNDNQGKDRPRRHNRDRNDDANLFINCNVPSAQVYIDNNLVGTVGATFTVPQGSYQLRISANGYQDFVTQINVQDDQTINANLNPVMKISLLTINSNVQGAAIFINNKAVGNSGISIPMPPGSYQIRVSAPGFMDFVGTVTMNGNQTVNANLQPLNYQLTVNANVRDAQVYLNNTAVGAVGQSYALQPGSYQVRIAAPGFQDFNATVQLNGNQVINAVLQAQSGNLSFELPRNSAILVFVDGAVQKRPTKMVLSAGQHKVRFEIGFLVAETIITVNPGQTVVVAPNFSITVK